MQHLEAVVIDLGETLVDETRQWSEWVDRLGVSTFTLFGAMGAAIGDRRHHLDAFEAIRPGFDLDSERAEREAAGHPWQLSAEDLYRPAAAIAYVGDRLDNDVLPAIAAGMTAIHHRRGPWGVIRAGWPEAASARTHLVFVFTMMIVIAETLDLIDSFVAKQPQMPAVKPRPKRRRDRAGSWGEESPLRQQRAGPAPPAAA